MKSNKILKLIMIIVVICIIVLDQLSKVYMINNIGEEGKSIINRFVKFYSCS